MVVGLAERRRGEMTGACQLPRRHAASHMYLYIEDKQTDEINGDAVEDR